MYLQNKYTSWYNSIISNAKSRTLSKEIYTEKHHIIPRSLGGNNLDENLVRLTAREHFLCHLLLPKMLTGINKRNMTFAIWSMLNRDHSKQRSRHKISSHTYQKLKIQVARASSEIHKGKSKSEETKRKMSAKAKGRTSLNKGKQMSEEQKQKMKDTIAKNGRIISPDTVKKILESRKDYTHSEETRQKIGAAHKGKTQIVTEEQKQKISATLKGRTPTWLVGKPAPNRGISHSSETVAKLKLAAQNRERLTCIHCGKTAPKCSFTRWHGDNCKNK
jgi:hypothetical protein